MRLNTTTLALIGIGVAVGLLLARFVLPQFGLVSGVDDSSLTRPVGYTP